MNRYAIGLALLFAAFAARADFNNGVAHYVRGEYEQAAKIFLPLAVNGNDPYAQRFLAEMYAKGQGVEQNHEEAAKWYRSSAEKGVAASQYKLGLMYRDGQGVPKDMEYAYAWFSVAAKQGNKLAPTALGGLDGQLSEQELGEAKKLAEEFIAKHGEAPKQRTEGMDEPLKQP
jgi:TPR repeat protein